jgi:SAM-dependent methyltransferase
VTIAASSHEVYYQSGYWNDYPSVRAEIDRRVSGDATRDYIAAFAEATHRRRFGRALFINCGNGWVEREFVKRGIIATGVGVDISDELLDQARAAAADLPLRYHKVDINTGAFPDERYDLIVNFSAAHHIAAIDRAMRLLCRALTPDGYFLAFDYVGPHRNQYSYEAWDAVWQLNRSLPAEVQQKLGYPHLPTMLVTDPSEAVHSELILPTYDRYFTRDTFRSAGGALAYPLLTFNDGLGRVSEELREATLRTVMAADAQFLATHPQSGLFAYWYGRAKHSVLGDTARLAAWTHEEEEREARAVANGGVYYPVTLLQALMYARATANTGAEL